MNLTLEQFLQIDLPGLLTGALVGVSCGLLGNFLVLRRQSLVGDAIAHTVLPGIVLAFLLFGTRATLPMLFGAIAAAVVAAGLIELVRKLGRVESGAAMGVVFSVMFALGVVLMEKAAADNTDLDAECVLYGQLEDIWWIGGGETASPTTIASLASPEVLASAPREMTTLAGVAIVSILLVIVFFKELRITSFDAALATTLGFRSSAFHFATMLLVAVAAVASFEAVGSILVIAMLICPAATARMLTDRFGVQLVLSACIGAGVATLGYLLAAGPAWFGSTLTLGASGMMAVVSGAILAIAIVFAPAHGWLAKRIRRLRLGVRIAREDLLAMLYRVEEAGGRSLAGEKALVALGATTQSPFAARLALRSALSHAEATRDNGAYTLTDAGRKSASSLVRTHRLWETYLVDELGLRADHVHRTAMELEHITTPEMEQELTPDLGETSAHDPHGKPIPPKPS